MSGYAFEALRLLEAAVIALPSRRSLPPEPATARMLREIGAAQSAPARPADQFLEGVRLRLGDGSESPRDLRYAPWILWHGNPQAIGFPGLLERVVKQAIERRSTLRNLIEAWLRDFAVDQRGVRETGLAIVALLQNNTDARLDIWRNAQTRFHMFDPLVGPRGIVTAVLGNQRPVTEVLASLGFVDELRATGGYMRAVHDECLAHFPRLLRGPDVADQFGCAVALLTHGKQLRFPDARRSIAQSLLGPWTDGRQSPSLEAQGLVKDFVLKYIGHPRLQPHLWIGADAESAVVRGWLARATLQLFFRLIAEHAPDSWQYRQAFWLSCLNKGAIADAWLALGPRVHASALARKQLGDAFGELAGSSGDQSVLLLRIGPIILAEWSHNGKLRAWPVHRAPKLYERTYHRAELIKNGLPFPADPIRPFAVASGSDHSGLMHVGSATGVWQRRAAALLAEHAGITLFPTDWQVR